jgi:hypothetical protein
MAVRSSTFIWGRPDKGIGQHLRALCGAEVGGTVERSAVRNRSRHFRLSTPLTLFPYTIVASTVYYGGA